MARALVALILAASLAVATEGQTLLDLSQTLGKEPAALTLPFRVSAGGSYRLTVTDFGSASGPARLARVDAGVMRGSELVTAQSLVASNATGVATKTFAASAGEHRLVLIGWPNAPAATVGSAGVRIEDAASGAVVLDTLQSFSVPTPATASPATFEHELQVTAGTYTLQTTDFALPQAMAALQTTVVGSGAVLANFSGSGQAVLTAASDTTFEVFVYAELPAGVARGLVGLDVRDAVGNAIAAELHELGSWPFRYEVDVTSAGNVTATLADLGFPLPLGSLAAAIASDGRRVASLTPTGPVTFAATPGSYAVYVAATPAASSPGSFGVRVTSGAGTLLDDIESVTTPGPLTDAAAIDRFFEIPAVGDYTLTLTDFGQSGFFDPFASLALALVRDGQIVDTLSAAGARTFAATPGRYDVAILADPAGAAGEGLLGLSVVGGPGNATVLDETEAVGSDFVSSTFTAASAGRIDVRVSDLAFPATFASIKVAVTRGADRVGEILGAGSFSFLATPGEYRVNLLAQPDSAVGYGTLGVLAGVTPPAPVVTLGASSQSVTVGAGATLTWSVSNASSCNASGAWSGARATTGSETISALNTTSTFTLTCTGSGGTDVESVTVNVTAAQRSGGGGATSAAWLVALAGLAAVRRARRGDGAVAR